MPTPTPQQIRAELDADPTARGYAAPRAANDWAAVAALLNARTFRGPAPLRELSAACLALGVTGSVKALLEVPLGGTDSPPTSLTLATKAGLYKVVTLIEQDYRLEEADCDDPSFAAGCDGLIAMGFLTEAGKASLLALGNNRRSRAEVLWGGGLPLSLSVAEVRAAGRT